MTWTLLANVKGPKGDIGSWDGGNLSTSADLSTFYGSTTSPYRLVSYSVPTDTVASSIIGAPVGAKAGILQAMSLGSTAALHIWQNAADGRVWRQAVYSTAASNTGWRETKRKGTKRVAEPLTVAGSAMFNTATDVGVRLPFRVPATPARWRVHLRNQNDRTATAFTGALSFTGVTVGKAAVDAEGRPTGQFNGGKLAVSLDFISSGSGAQWVSEWMDYTLLPGEDYILSYGYTSAAQNNHASVGGGWTTDLGSGAINTDSTALTPTKNAPLDVWMAYEVDEEVPQFAYFGDSLTAGVSADLPVYDSWAKRHAMANGAFAQIYAYSGTGYSEWTSSSQSRFSKYTAFSGVAKPERLYVAMGSNDLSSATASTVRDRFNVTIPILKSYTSSSLYLLTILPRLDATAAFETNRLEWNEILRTELPGNAVACFDAADALEDPSGSVLDLRWRASEADIHLNKAGYARYAAALTASGGSTSGTANVDTLAALPAANIRNEGNTYYVAAEGKPYFSNGTIWQPVSSGAAGPAGPTGAGVPAGGSALQVVRKNSANTTTEWATLSKGDLGLGAVDNTADEDKPVSTAAAAGLAGKVSKGDLSYNVADYADAATAVAAAYADGRTLHWPYGGYASAASIPNLHKVRHTGKGWLVRGGVNFYLAPTYSQTNTLYTDPAGTSANDGLSAGQPMNLLSTVFGALNNYGPVLQGNWVVQMAAGTYNDQAITGQQSINRIWVYGATVATGATPTTIFDPGASGFTKAMGGNDFLNIGIKDVKVQNYNTADVPAIDFNTHCDIWYSNVWASGNNIGFRMMNHTKYRMDGCVAENNTQYGILELFSVVRDFKGGGTANPTYLRGNGKVGIKAKELCTGHLDGAIVYDNMHGVHFSRSCTANGTSMQIYRNQYGVTLRNQSSFVPLSIDWKFGTADANTVTPWDVEGSSSFVSNENEATSGKFSGRGEHLLGSFAPDPAYLSTGVTAATTFATFGNLRQGSLARPGGYVKVLIIGSKGGTTGTATIDFRFGGSSAGTIVIPATATAFKIEVMIFSRGPGLQTVYATTDVSGVGPQRVDRTYDVAAADYVMSARATMASGTDSLTINGAWCYTTEALATE